YGYCKNHKKRAKTGQKRTRERKEYIRDGNLSSKVNKSKLPPTSRMKFLDLLKDSRRHLERHWERFKEMLRACPHHGFTKVTQIDTFYNGLNENDQDSLNTTTDENLLSKTTREALNIIENKLKVCYSRYKPNVSRMNTNSRKNDSKTDERIDKLADQISTFVDIFAKKVVTPATVKAVEESCVTCGGNHARYNCDATNSNQSSVCVETSTYNQVTPQNRASNHLAPPGFALVQNNSQNIQHKEESIHDYCVRFAKLINDMRNIKMIMSKLQLNSKFVNNMLLEWGRFVTAVKLNRGLRDSNYDQLFAYLKQHEAHAKENKMMLERLSQPIAQPTSDPLALLSNASYIQHGSPSSSTLSFT
nr:reverse transcriptase domain-containing protein [Tanacetum cinerariifolium]